MDSWTNFGADWRYRIPNWTIQTHFGTFFIKNLSSGLSKPSGPGLRSSQGRFFSSKNRLLGSQACPGQARPVQARSCPGQALSRPGLVQARPCPGQRALPKTIVTFAGGGSRRRKERERETLCARDQKSISEEEKRPCEERSPGPEGLESPENQLLMKIEPKWVWMVGFGVRYRQSVPKLHYECLGIPPGP